MRCLTFDKILLLSLYEINLMSSFFLNFFILILQYQYIFLEITVNSLLLIMYISYIWKHLMLYVFKLLIEQENCVRILKWFIFPFACFLKLTCVIVINNFKKVLHFSVVKLILNSNFIILLLVSKYIQLESFKKMFNLTFSLKFEKKCIQVYLKKKKKIRYILR